MIAAQALHVLERPRSLDVGGGGLFLAQKLLRHLHMLGHADLAIGPEGFMEQIAGPVAVAGCVSVDEHAGVPAPHLRLFDSIGYFVSSPEGELIVLEDVRY